METKKLIICRGIQGSGKSTWAKQWCHEDPENRIRFNNDDIRNMLGDYWVPNREKVVTATYNTVLAYSMEKGYNIVVDNMNLNPKTCAELEKMVKDFNENYTYDWKYEVEYKDFFIPVDECIRRDAMRPNPIGEKVIKATWRRYRDFIIQEDIKSMLKRAPKHVDGGRPVILVDMDATLCLNTTGREGTPEIIAATKKWLAKHDVVVDELFFRPVKDYSPGADWGDINPATKKVEGDYGQKYTGCVSEKESLITPENGFKLIETLEAGMSPLSYQRDLEYEKLMNKSNEIQG